jgi:hypothetical protein
MRIVLSHRKIAFPGNVLLRQPHGRPGIHAFALASARNLALTLIVMVTGCSTSSSGIAVRLPATENFERHTESGWHCRRDVGEIEWSCEGEVPEPIETEVESLALATPAMGGTPTDADLTDQLPEPALVVPLAIGGDDAKSEVPLEAVEGPSSETRTIVQTHIRAGDYTVQVIALASMAAIRDFAADHEIDDRLIVPVVAESRVYFALLHGFYPDRFAAEEAIVTLSEELQSLSPRVRSSDDLGEAIARARSLLDVMANRDGD